MTAPLVLVEGVSKSFTPAGPLRRLLRRSAPVQQVLRGVDLAVDRGDWLALMGVNGAGKTTLLKVLAGLLLPDSGRASVAGFDVIREEQQARGLAGYVLADERSFYWRLTARQNLEFFAALNGLHGRAARDRICTLLDRLDLLDVADTSFATFSSGMKQRLAVARALLVRPRVLLMDEPARSLDAGHAAALWQFVREEISDRDGCVILVTHQVEEALTQCQQAAILDDGRIVLNTAVHNLRPAASVLDGYTIAVRGLSPAGLNALRTFQGVRDIRVASQTGGEQLLEVWTHNGDLPLAGFIGELTGAGATLCSLQRAAPLQGVLEQVTAHLREGACA